MSKNLNNAISTAHGLVDSSLMSGTFLLKTSNLEAFEKSASGIFQAFRYLAILGGLNEARMEYFEDEKLYKNQNSWVNKMLGNKYNKSKAAHFLPFIAYAIKSMTLDIFINLKSDPWKSLKKAANLALILATFKAFAVAAPFLFLGITIATFASGYKESYEKGIKAKDFARGQYLKAFPKSAAAATTGSLMAIVSLFVLPIFAIGGAAALGISIAGSALQTTFGTANAFYNAHKERSKGSDQTAERGYSQLSHVS
jgi:hypothetical protein